LALRAAPGIAIASNGCAVSSMRQAHEQAAGLTRVMALNETAKELIQRSRLVSLLALDALVQTKRAGHGLRGFGEVSSQIRSWSRDLHGELVRLGAASNEAVQQISRICKEAHFLRLLQQAALQSSQPSVRDAASARTAEQDERLLALERSWHSIQSILDDLAQLGLMAVALSRSAMIEAAGSPPEQRAQLSHVSQEFYCNSEAVVTALKAIIKLLEAQPHEKSHHHL
jgi:hypothetical protein